MFFGKAVIVVCISALIVLGGCATRTPSGRKTDGMPIFTKRAYTYKTTGLFTKTCKGEEEKERVAGSESKDKAKAQQDKKEKSDECRIADIERMIAVFFSIQETGDKNGIKGDTIEEVRRKGFTIYADERKKTSMKNTQPFYGNDALTLIGMGTSPPQLDTPEKIEAYNNYMKSIYGEAYYETDLEQESDRICINTDEIKTVGDDRIFVIVWKGGHVFQRGIKGGRRDETHKEEAFLKCPGGFVGRTLEGGVNRTMNFIK